MTRPTLEQLNQIKDEVFRAWNAHDPLAMRDLLTDDIEWHEPEGTYSGKDEVAQAMQETFDAFPDSTWPTDEVLVMPAADHEHMAVTWTWRGTQTGAYQGLPATGKQIDVSGVTVVELRGTKIKKVTFHFDTYDYLSQLGVVPATEGIGFKVLALTEFSITKARDALHI